MQRVTKSFSVKLQIKWPIFFVRDEILPAFCRCGLNGFQYEPELFDTKI